MTTWSNNGHIVCFKAPEIRPQPPETGLHFVRNAEPAVGPYDVIHDLEVLRRGIDDAAGPLNRLGDERGDLAGCLVGDELLHVAGTFDVT